MNGRKTSMLLAALLVPVLLPTVASAAAPAAKAGAAKATLVPADKLEWKDAVGFPAGVKAAALWGDAAKGPHAQMMKLPAGLSAPLHHHNSDHQVTVVSGTLVLTPEGDAAATKLPPGSAFRLTGKKRHTTSCEAGADCVLSMVTAGPWDLVMDDKKDDKKK
jgi:quercetin dioxygenase-like cupin family protein